MGLNLPTGFNWFLILIAAVVGVLVVLTCIYILVDYQHPEDRLQAWVPKIIVVFGLSLAICQVLMFPLDVANKKACSADISPSSCHYTFPMETMWQVVFFANLVMVFAILPFTMFFYEADSDFTWFQKMKSAVFWTLGMMTFIGMTIGILYSLVGYVIYPTQKLSSGTLPLTALQNLTGSYGGLNITSFSCIPTTWLKTSPPTADLLLCSAFQPTITITEWKLRVSLPVYVMAVQSIIGWLLFMVFAGTGVLAAPIDWIQTFISRPTAVITKSEYLRRARLIAQRARLVVAMTQTMRRQEKDRKWRSNFKKLEREVNNLEEDEYQLERVFPQGEDGDVRWVLFMLSFWLTGFMGVFGMGISLAWLAHIIVYMMPTVPFYPLLNNMFVALDDAFSLLGVIFFGGFCLYLMVVAMKGNFLLGMNLVVVKLYPMRPGATLMSSFLVNTAVILCMAPAVLQFCATAFAVYAGSSDIYDVFGNQVMYLQGIQWIYQLNIFLYFFFVFVLLSVLWMVFRGKDRWQRKRDKFDVYADI